MLRSQKVEFSAKFIYNSYYFATHCKCGSSHHILPGRDYMAFALVGLIQSGFLFLSNKSQCCFHVLLSIMRWSIKDQSRNQGDELLFAHWLSSFQVNFLVCHMLLFVVGCTNSKDSIDVSELKESSTFVLPYHVPSLQIYHVHPFLLSLQQTSSPALIQSPSLPPMLPIHSLLR